ncbi:glutamate--tRNA ligase [Pseudokineococcus marinus]|uniref:Glutamate--tRNA ligase n=1 Tax=Pseudokineococcus marinus TaxID=351215 RepID=A0A849BJH0_9ACTN|nr:glutamate--tRNA ligase [Pseudokineococcus marinus]NNH22771.1 glutamate--tRNA ligase [Pseudokineococcus marinus]
MSATAPGTPSGPSAGESATTGSGASPRAATATGLAEATGADVRVRFCPSPTGTPHVGVMRAALFNWAYARHTGGKLVFRIEDTDAARDSQESMDAIVEGLAWLGIDYDEGPGVGGPHAPYRQSERRDLYADVARRLLEEGYAYESWSTPEEVEERHRAAGRDPKLGYDGFDRDLSAGQVQAFRDEGREPVLRVRMPDEDVVVDDLVRGRVVFPAGSVPDFVVVRANGQPLYTLVNPVDDAVMGITHVLRGEDLLSSTPRQVVLHRALVEVGLSQRVPQFGHLPLVLGEGNRKLSKRDPESDLFLHRERGLLPEGMVNYLALLGWSIAPDRDVFTREELVAAFDVRDIGANPARWDQKKAEAINGDHLRMLAPEVLLDRLLPHLRSAGLLDGDPTPTQRRLLEGAVPLVQTRMAVLSEGPGMLGFLLVADEDLVVEEDALGALRPEAADVLDASAAALVDLPEWDAAAVEAALRAAVVDGLGVKPKFAFGPLRTAVTGRRVSPPLFESMELLGRESSMLRIAALRRQLG